MNYSNLPSYTKEYFSYGTVPNSDVCTAQRICQLKVEGKGSIKVRPDVAIVVLGVITENKELSQAQEENTTRMTAVLRSLRENGIPIEDIQTLSYNITPQYDYIEGKQIFRGYRVEHSLEVTIRDMIKIGKIIDDAVQSGVNQVSSINFTVSNPSTYYQLALNAAVDDALKKARTLGNKLNIAISKVPVKIVELGYDTEVPVPKTYQVAGLSTPIQTGSIEISARIEVVFVYSPI